MGCAVGVEGLPLTGFCSPLVLHPGGFAAAEGLAFEVLVDRSKVMIAASERLGGAL